MKCNYLAILNLCASTTHIQVTVSLLHFQTMCFLLRAVFCVSSLSADLVHMHSLSQIAVRAYIMQEKIKRCNPKHYIRNMCTHFVFVDKIPYRYTFNHTNSHNLFSVLFRCAYVCVCMCLYACAQLWVRILCLLNLCFVIDFECGKKCWF